MRDPVEEVVTKDNWAIRRRVLFVTLIYIAFNVSWLIVSGDDSVMHTQIVLTLIGSGVAIVMTYVFGAIGDDHFKRKFLQKFRGASPPGPGRPDDGDRRGRAG